MANSNRVFVSPGVYTSEVDLTFVAQSVGVTTLGLVGETLKGPAFEPILISSWDEFTTYFGSSSPELDGVGNPKYELPYFAKSYLSEANQLFVTRILGYTGYKQNATYGISTLGGVKLGTYSGVTSGLTMSATTTTVTASTIYSELTGKTAVNSLSIPNYITTTLGTGTTDNSWFTIGLVPSSYTSGLTGTNLVSPATGRINSADYNGKEWYNIYYHLSNPAVDTTVDSVFSYLFVYSSGSSRFNVTKFTYNASLNTDYDDIIVAALRSRGHYSNEVLTYEVTGSSSVTISSTSDLSQNPYADFTLSVTGRSGGAKTITCNLDSTSNKSITKVLGTDVFDRDYTDNPLYVFETYPNFLLNAFEQGYVRGITTEIIYDSNNDSFLPNPNGDYGSTKAYDTPMSPTVVSEVRGGKVLDLFNIITISDGDAANNEVKISIQNINIDNGEFDLIVRDFYDSDSNQVVLDKFSRCSMNPDVPGYVALKVGTSDGQYPLLSKYIMLNIDPNAPSDAIPAGFRGFVRNSAFGSGNDEDSHKLGSVLYKTKYFTAGDTMYYDNTGTPVTSSGDKVRNVTLGLSSSNGFNYDADLFSYKGWRSAGQTFGFHLSVNATGITQTGTTYLTTPYDLEGQSGTGNMLLTSANRKFTFAVCGGFDGWDIYRQTRTYGDAYILGKKTYTYGNTNNGGVFNPTVGNSDYYSYNDGIQTFANPEAIDINVFATPGINFFDHSSLTNQAIEMIEVDRADSLYIISSPNESTADGVIGDIMDQEYDSNYSATYWPWIQIKDVDNATQLYIPPTGEVLKNIALTDNIAYPWYSTAGYSRGLVNSIKAVKKLTADERDELYKNRINPIATFSDTGTIIWGNKTLQVRESALDRINVRRLLLRARKLISAVCVRLLFEQNDDQIRQEFLRLVNPILEAIKKERGLTDFRVTVSNDPADIDANTLRGKIFIKPTRSLEFIDVEFVITPTGASFENI